MPHISVQVEPIAHVGAAACECKKVGIPGQAIFCNSLLKAARQTNSHLTLSSKRAAPGMEPGTSRTRSENHATRPSSQLAACASPDLWPHAREEKNLCETSRTFLVSATPPQGQSSALRYREAWCSKIHQARIELATFSV